MLGRYDRALRARQPQGGAPFTPRSIGAQVWYDPSDLSTLFQDAAGTTPVTAVGQQVGRMLDKSGRGNHATQTTLTSRPILQQDASGRYYLSSDGVDDGMETGLIDLTYANKVTVCLGVEKSRNSSAESIVELGNAPASGPGTFWINSSGIATGDYWFAMAKNSTERTGFSSAKSAPTIDVLSVLFDFSGYSRSTEVFPRINGSVPTLTGGLSASAGDSNFGSNRLFLFRRAGISAPFNGRFYGLAIAPSLLSPANLTRLEAYMNRKTGAF